MKKLRIDGKTVVLVDEVEELHDTVYNLRLYLDYVRREAPGLWEDMGLAFSGMPGWVQPNTTEYGREDISA